MINHRNYKLHAVPAVLLVATILVFTYGPAQVTGAGKPKPPAPKIYPPLIVDQLNPQIVGKGVGTDYYNGRLVQIKRTGEQIIDGKTVGKYEDTWASNAVSPSGFAIGDADNDGSKEIIAALSVYSGLRSGKDKLYDWKIVGFESGSNGATSWETGYFYRNTGRGGPLGIGDVDKDGSSEIFIYLDTHIEIIQLKWVNGSLSLDILGKSPDYAVVPIWSLGAGDSDNLGDNEILYSIFDQTGIPRILKYNGSSWAEETNIDPVAVSAIDVVKARDADNAPGNEIVAGGNNSRLMIWKYLDGYYRNIFMSDVLPSYTQGVDAGDVDEFPGNEIVVGATGSGFYFFKYDQSYYPSQVFLLGAEPINGLALEDMDGDSKSEIVTAMSILKIFDLQDGTLVKSFEFPYASQFRTQ